MHPERALFRSEQKESPYEISSVDFGILTWEFSVRCKRVENRNGLYTPLLDYAKAAEIREDHDDDNNIAAKQRHSARHVLSYCLF